MVKGPLVVVVGPTASGKTALSLSLAKRFNGEIIAADSRTVYRGMDIGTAKPTAAEQNHLPHHLLDIVNPDETFTVAEYKRRADLAIQGISGHGSLPLLVGGTGLYIDAVLYDYQFPPGASATRRAELEAVPLTELVKRLQQQDPERATQIDLKNKRRVVRALETVGVPRIAPKALPDNIFVLGLNPGMEELEKRIKQRTQHMLANGLIEECEQLLERYYDALEPLRSVGYAEAIQMLLGKLPREQLEGQINVHTRQLAKRQLTWFKRNPDINWVDSTEEASELVKKFLA